MIFGYSRVSKGDEQNARLQLKAFKDANVEKTFREAASEGRWDRPELHKMLDQLRQDDVVIVWKLDRLSRSLKDLLVIMERIHQSEAGFKSLTEAIDTTTPTGRMMMQMVGAFAEFEREMTRERTQAGLKVAKDEGRTGSRKPTLREDQRTDIIENILDGRKTGAQMARLYNVSEATTSRVMAAHRQVLARD
jgi:DNA invertase Pin-like site-specific DNA recombinase